jgi:hypothetical protein
MKNISSLKNYITDTKQTLKNNISSVRMVTKADILQHKADINNNITKLQQQLSNTNKKITVNDINTKSQLNSALIGKHMYWEACPNGWNETGGVYPVKVCVNK